MSVTDHQLDLLRKAALKRVHQRGTQIHVVYGPCGEKSRDVTRLAAPLARDLYLEADVNGMYLPTGTGRAEIAAAADEKTAEPLSLAARADAVRASRGFQAARR